MASIGHVAIWSADIERLRAFYTQFFGATSGERYVNPGTGFQSYFLSFESGSRLELMQRTSIPPNLNSTLAQYLGLIHIAFSVGSQERVDTLTAELEQDGFMVVSAPRRTGDGYYESVVLDPDGNRVEITV